MKIEKIWLTDDAVWIRRDDGVEASEMFSDYPRLLHASKEQRADFIIDDYGISWPELDEDLLFVSAVARRMGISQSLFAQYVSGTKKPSEKRLREIYDTIRMIGSELQGI